MIFAAGSTAATEDADQIGADFGEIEEEFGRFLDESLTLRGPDSLGDLLAGADPPVGGIAVDVGCGRGRDAVRLASRFGLQVHGIDPSPINVQQAKDRAAAEGLDHRIDVHLGRAEAIPLPDRSVDVLWCKEVITFTDPIAAMREFRRVLRPGAVGLIYQVLTGPAMTAVEAHWLASQELGFGPARELRPADVEEAIRVAGLEIRQRVDYASEWGEAGQERDGSAGRRLTHAARLLRTPQRYIDRYGAANYRIMLADCLWHVYRMIGKLWGVAFLLRA
ncbi:class I SAM-dependent methyltransferase [Microlunatus speluncae]|uniref:class I SAM-dependent methyltransferase n=1 Tax=Microlunatus speluncae TaxID=2594267 RepID=UPI0013755C35|nr:class I SAM-dependent methyltransferase [Microlunatus speluncae]